MKNRVIITATFMAGNTPELEIYKCLQLTILMDVEVYTLVKQKQSEGLQSLAGRISLVYKLYNRVAYNGDMKADVHGYGENCNRGSECWPRAILETIGHRPQCQIQKLFILISPTVWHQSRLSTTIRLRDMTKGTFLTFRWSTTLTFDLKFWK